MPDSIGELAEGVDSMLTHNHEWDPSWDKDWQAALGKLEEGIEEEHPLNPAEAVEYYRYGFIAARKHPLHEWPEVESEFYQDYMTGAPESGEQEGEEEDWERAREWARRGWEVVRA